MYDYFCLWGFCKQKYFFAFWIAVYS